MNKDTQKEMGLYYEAEDLQTQVFGGKSYTEDKVADELKPYKPEIADIIEKYYSVESAKYSSDSGELTIKVKDNEKIDANGNAIYDKIESLLKKNNSLIGLDLSIDDNEIIINFMPAT